MPFNYTPLALQAFQLVKDFGKSVTLVKWTDIPADTTKPWRGNLTPRETPEDSAIVSLVFVEPSSAEELGLSVVKFGITDRRSRIGIVAPDPLETRDFTDYDEIIEGELLWKINAVEALEPGPLRMLYFFSVTR